MTDTDFSEYAVKYSAEVRDFRSNLPEDLLRVLIETEAALSNDPYFQRDRLHPALTDDKTLIYFHPYPEFEVTFRIDSENETIHFLHVSAPMFKTRKTIFISYSHVDNDWKEELVKYLSVLEQKGVVEFWDDSRLEPGLEWKTRIADSLKSAEAGLLLVSQDFLKSRFITEFELPQLLKNAKTEGKRVFWIHVRPSTVFSSHREITEFQSLIVNPKKTLYEMKKPKRERVMVEMSEQLGNALTSR